MSRDSPYSQNVMEVKRMSKWDEDKEFRFRLEEIRKLRERIKALYIAYPVIDHRDGFISKVMDDLQNILMEVEGLFKLLKDQIDKLDTDLKRFKENLLELTEELAKLAEEISKREVRS